MFSHEEALIAALRSEADIDACRLIYADYLEEHGDPTRAEFLRLSVELSHLWEQLMGAENRCASPLVAPVARLRLRLHELYKDIPEQWLAQVHCGSVDVCDHQTKRSLSSIVFGDQRRSGCPSRWERLADGDDPLVRRCEVCKDSVFFCVSTYYAMYEQRKPVSVVTLPFMK